MTKSVKDSLQGLIENNLTEDSEGCYYVDGNVVPKLLPENVTEEQYVAVHEFDRDMLSATTELAGEMALGYFKDDSFNSDKVTLEIQGIEGVNYAASIMRDEGDVSVSAGIEHDLGDTLGQIMDAIVESVNEE